MDGVSQSSWFRSARSRGVFLLALIVVLGVGGYLLTSTTIRRDRDAEAERRARVEAVHTQEVLGRARAYVGGLAEVLARETEPGQARFARWAGATSASVGLNDVLWVERVPGTERARYERRRGVRITRLQTTGEIEPVPAAPSYLPASFTSETRPGLRPGIDVTGFPGLADAIRDRARIFAVGASRPGALAGEPGFFLLQAAGFARGSHSRGYLVAFVPRGWFSTTLGGDPRRLAISQDGERIEGELESVQANAAFETLGRRWRIDVAREPPSGLQSLLPWLALAWPFAAAGVMLPVGRAITLRRRAQSDLERIFEMSLDLISVAGYDGHFKTVNPAFERTLRYSEEELLARPFIDFVHPDDRDATRETFAEVLGGKPLSQFENRYISADGSERWLQWSARAVPEEELVYATARDVTEGRRMHAQQAALRRVATLVAREASQAEVFAAIADECAQLFGTQEIRLVRFDENPSPSQFVVASLGKSAEYLPVGSRQPLVGENTTSRVFRTGRPARMDDYATTASGPIGEASMSAGIQSIIGVPVMVEGRLWGAMGVASRDGVLPRDSESRLGEFTELMATAIANAESHAREERLAEEQAALRRVATLVAEGASPGAVLDAVAAEMEALLDADQVALNRFEPGNEILVVAHRGLDVSRTPVGSRLSSEGESAIARVRRTGRPARIEGYDAAGGPIAELARVTGLRSSVGVPIAVEGRLWGLVTASWKTTQSPPPDTEERMVKFASLLDTAIANTEARAEVERLAGEQAALRRVATLVAEGGSATAVFDAVAAEMAGLLNADHVLVGRYEPGSELTVLAHRGSAAEEVPPGARISHEGDCVEDAVRRTERSARVESYEGARGAIPELARAAGVHAAVGAPIVVEGRLWGVVAAGWSSDVSPPHDTEERMAQFAQLLDTAVANADSREQLTASRARLVTAGDEARRRVVRDLHDGAQQRLVHTIVTLKLAGRALRAGEGDGRAESLIGEALRHAEHGNAELRELAHGILPAAVTRGGLRAGVGAFVERLDLPVRLDLPDERMPSEIEASAYFVAAEALTNVVKHSHATRAEVRASVEDGELRLQVEDDGIGGADPAGHGLVGMDDRVTALGGRLEIESRAGGGTRVVATLPLHAG